LAGDGRGIARKALEQTSRLGENATAAIDVSANTVGRTVLSERRPGEELRMQWPDWWNWELEISSHRWKRMSERGFSETDLRAMLDDAVQLVEQTHGTFPRGDHAGGSPMGSDVSPDEDHRLVVVVTAYPC
jgi:hypothetical protein